MRDIAFTNDGRRFVTCSYDRFCKLCDADPSPNPDPNPITLTLALTLALTLTLTLTLALTIRDVEEHRDEAGAAEQVRPHVDRLVVELRRDAGRRVIRHQGSRSGQAGSRLTWNSDLTHERRSWFAL